MNLETYLREKRAKGYYAFGMSIVKLSLDKVRINIAPMRADRYLEDEEAKLVVKDDVVTMDGEIHDHVKRLVEQSKEGLNIAKITNQVNNFHEHEDEYLKRILADLNIRMDLKGIESVKEYLEQMEITLLPGGKFKFDL